MTDELFPGAILHGRYRLGRPLGRGGQGTVYEALDLHAHRHDLQEKVAIKIKWNADEGPVVGIRHEANILRQLSHKSVPKFRDYFEERDAQFLVMQFVEGKDLEALRKEQDGGRFAWHAVVRWGEAILEGLEWLHSQTPPVIHRDIKPRNLKLDRFSSVKLLDFGIAKRESTRLGVGTEGYASPEQDERVPSDPRTDLYSLAASLYRLMTGIRPPSARDRREALAQGEEDPLRPACEVVADIPREIAYVLHKAMAFDREERFTTAAEMCGRLVAARIAEETRWVRVPVVPLPLVAPERAVDRPIAVPFAPMPSPVELSSRGHSGKRVGLLWVAVPALVLSLPVALIWSLLDSVVRSQAATSRAARSVPPSPALVSKVSGDRPAARPFSKDVRRPQAKLVSAPVVASNLSSTAPAAPGAENQPTPQPSASPLPPPQDTPIRVTSEPPRTVEVIVPANRGWVETDIVLAAGDSVRITAAGRIRLDEYGSTSGPFGTGAVDGRRWMPAHPVGGLIAMVGTSNYKRIFVGDATEFTAPYSGKLSFGINEREVEDNSGAFSVRVEYGKADFW